MDQDFRNHITGDRVYTCDKHFNSEDIEICKKKQISIAAFNTKKKPLLGASLTLPLLNMPRRSHERETSKPLGRRSIVREVKPIEHQLLWDFCRILSRSQKPEISEWVEHQVSVIHRSRGLFGSVLRRCSLYEPIYKVRINFFCLLLTGMYRRPSS